MLAVSTVFVCHHEPRAPCGASLTVAAPSFVHKLCVLKTPGRLSAGNFCAWTLRALPGHQLCVLSIPGALCGFAYVQGEIGFCVTAFEFHGSIRFFFHAYVPFAMLLVLCGCPLLVVDFLCKFIHASFYS